MEAAQNKGTAIKDLRTAPGLIAVISTAGFGSDVPSDIDDWCFTWKSMPCGVIDDKVLGKPHRKGLNVLLIDLKRFRKKAETPKTFLEFYLAFLNCGTYEDIEALLKMDPDGIMEDIIRMDMDFLGNDNLWEPFMKKENKNLLALNTARDEVDEMEKKVAIADAMAEQERLAREKSDAMAEQERQAREKADAVAEQERQAREKSDAMAEQERQAREKSDAMAEQERQAREEAEAMLARERKAREESDAKVFALEDLVKGLQSQIKAMLENSSLTNQPDLN